jgi:hypothetical protein
MAPEVTRVNAERLRATYFFATALWILAATAAAGARSSIAQALPNTRTNQQPTVVFSPSSNDQERRDQPVTNEDLEILKRADKILSSPEVWNRHDTRVCKPEDKTWSLFCAMEKASLDVLGEYRHREVALQEVRFAVEDVTKGIEFEHRMMDYNNLPSTTFSDIKHVIKTATDRVSARLAAQKKQEKSK